jgi:hypothetical protein
VKIKFSIPTNGYPINEIAPDDTPPHEVDNALSLSSSHYWTSKNTPWPPSKYIYVKWLSETHLNDTLLIHVLPGWPGCDPSRTSTVAIGDPVTLPAHLLLELIILPYGQMKDIALQQVTMKLP